LDQAIIILIDLQRLDTRIETLSVFMDELPASRELIAGERQAAENEVVEKRDALEESKLNLRKKESELQAGEERIKRIQAKLNQVKTNKEYEAALKEIEDQKVLNGELESDIIVLMDQVEESEESKKKLESEWDERAEEFNRRSSELEAKAKVVGEELAGKMKSRDELVPQISAELLAKYNQIKEKIGTVVVKADKEVCQGCFQHIPAQQYNLVLKGEQVISCASCLRIMVHPESKLDDETQEDEPQEDMQ